MSACICVFICREHQWKVFSACPVPVELLVVSVSFDSSLSEGLWSICVVSGWMKGEKDFCWSPGSVSLSGTGFIVYSLNRQGRVMWWHPDKTLCRKIISQSNGLTAHTPQNRCRQYFLAYVNIRVFFFPSSFFSITPDLWFDSCYDAFTVIDK